MQRIVQDLKCDWLYLPADRAEAAAVECDERDFAAVSLPHTNIELPFHGFSEQDYCFVSWYRRRLDIPAEARGRRVFIDFGAVMIAATVFINGKPVAPEHKGGYTPFSYDITDHVAFGSSNVLAVRVDSTERKDIPPFGNVVDYLTFGGIYREVTLRIVDPVYIMNLFAQPRDVLLGTKRLVVTAHLANTTGEPRSLPLRASLAGPDGAVVRSVSGSVEIPAGGTVDRELVFDNLAGIRLWDLQDPALYQVTVTSADGDALSTRTGFRTAEFSDADGAFHLNGRAIKLRGLNRHQTFPYIGQAAPARLQRRDADIIRFDLGCNIVRTSHYPQSPHFLDRCDEIGLLVLEEITGWQHIGDGDWKTISVAEVEAMVMRDRNHPSIILWGVRINESRDDDEFYTRTNNFARWLDPTRQTGGIRFNYDSHLLEDVFTMNDFAYDLKPPNHPRYLNTEFCGHMYPAKSFDQEERARQHALHHAHVLNQVYGQKSAGGIGWCAFDYNTHADFGSGDRICYHGVMDIFREPKLAAHFYASQVDPETKIVLEPATYWTMGDKSGSGVEPLIVFSNVDEIEVFVGTASKGRFKPSRDAYPNLPRPPFVVTGLGNTWGSNWQDLAVVGYRDGREVARRQMSRDGVPRQFVACADDKQILADGSDMTRISMRLCDEFGNILPYAMQPVTLRIEGPGVLVGENPFSMPGGRGAVFVRSTRQPGTITVFASTARLPEQRVQIESTA